LEYAVKKHIEFFGLPGTGKTTLAHELCVFLKSKNHKALLAEQALYVAMQRSAHYYELRYPIKYCSYDFGKRWLQELYMQPRFSYDPLNRFLSEHEKMLETLCAIFQHPESIQECALLIKWLVRLCNGYQLAKENLKHDEILLIDEGFCNRAISIFGYGREPIDPGKLRKYIRCMPAPDGVICVEAPLETREKRLLDRGFPARLKGLSAGQRKELYSNFEACASMVVEGLKNRGIPVVSVNNDGSLEHFYQHAGDKLDRIFDKPDTIIP